MKKELLIVCPAPERCRAKKQKQPVVEKFFRHTRLSLLTVAAATPPDWNVTIVDEYVSPIDFHRHYDCVAVSFMTAGAPRAYQIANIFRQRGIPVFAGGFHSSFLPDEVLQHFDAVCVGDAEFSWPTMLQDLEHGALQKIYRSDPCSSLHHLPLPRRDLLSEPDYFTRNSVQTSRGCPHTCEFCSISAFHRGTYRHRPVENVLAEIQTLSGKLIIFIDDNIVADRTYALQLFVGLKSLNRHWFSQCELKIAQDPELLEAAVESGCKGLFIGFESLSDENLKNVDKGFYRVEEYLRSIETLHNAGIAIEAGIVFGFDDDGPNVFENTLNFLNAGRVEIAQITILTPFPGTPLFDQFQQAGRILSTDWQYYDFSHTVFRPKRLSPEELQRGTDAVIEEFYNYPSIFKRVLASAKHLGLSTALSLILPLNLAIKKRVNTWEQRPSSTEQGLYWLEPEARQPKAAYEPFGKLIPVATSV